MSCIRSKSLPHILLLILLVLCVSLSLAYPHTTSAQQQQTTAQNQQAAQTSEPVDCTSNWSIVRPTCWLRGTVAGLGALFMALGIELATLAGAAFEFILQHGIVEFGQTLAYLKPGIDTGWTALRDIANIVIIGLFVFTAINIILGTKDFGEKRRIAKVLIVAVLINFSLVFTKVIIDASNFTAYQFYNSMIKSIDTSAPDTAQGAAVSATGIESGIAGRFLQLLGVRGIKDSYGILRNAQETQQDWMAALWFGLLSFMFLIAVALVFAYGAWLMLSRAVLLVILLISSALAFASWLIPQAYIEKGFITWWESLLKAAFFAPILMAFLWIASLVAGSLANNSQFANKGTLGALAANPSSEANLSALFSFLLIIGLLFAAFKASSAFAHTIAGFQGASGIAMTPFAFAARGLGFAGRIFPGLPAGYTAEKMRRSENWSPSAEMNKGKPWRLLRNRMLWKPLDWMSQKSFDAMNVGTVRTAAGALGAYTFGKQVGVGGAQASVDRLADRIEKQGRRAAPPTDVREKTAKAEGEKAGTKFDEVIKDWKAALPRADAAGRTGEEGHAKRKGTTRAKIEEEHGKAEALVGGSEREIENVRKRFAEEIAKAATDSAKAELGAAQAREIGRINDRLKEERAELARRKEALDEMWEAGRLEKEKVLQPLTEAMVKLGATAEHLKDLKEGRVDKARSGVVRSTYKQWDKDLQGGTISRSFARNPIYAGRRLMLQGKLAGKIKKSNISDVLAEIANTGAAPAAAEEK